MEMVSLKILAPLVILQLILIVTALINLKNQETNGPKWLWVFIICFINILGPILYFIFGRKQN